MPILGQRGCGDEAHRLRQQPRREPVADPIENFHVLKYRPLNHSR
jgi:hypothetical protein